ncbi:phage tail protein, partial [Escherichia coli]|nr:phage tail protein [Escherichia coli]
MADKTSPEYAMLPAGTIVKYGEPGAATAALKPLINCKALGAMGQTGGFVDCTTLLDKQK